MINSRIVQLHTSLTPLGALSKYHWEHITLCNHAILRYKQRKEKVPEYLEGQLSAHRAGMVKVQQIMQEEHAAEGGKDGEVRTRVQGV